MYFINLCVASTLYIIGISLGMYFAGFTYKQLTHEELEEEKQKEQEMLKNMEILNFPHLYEDEIHEYDDFSKEYNKESLKDIIIEHEVPLNSVIMYYDHTTDAFCYYTKKGDVVYKYLNVVCRKYVIDNNCKELYKEGIKYIEEKEPILAIENCFFHKKEKKNKVKESKITNKFIRMGSFEDYYTKKIPSSNHLSFTEYFSNK